MPYYECTRGHEFQGAKSECPYCRSPVSKKYTDEEEAEQRAHREQMRQVEYFLEIKENLNTAVKIFTEDKMGKHYNSYSNFKEQCRLNIASRKKTGLESLAPSSDTETNKIPLILSVLFSAFMFFLMVGSGEGPSSSDPFLIFMFLLSLGVVAFAAIKDKTAKENKIIELNNYHLEIAKARKKIADSVSDDELKKEFESQMASLRQRAIGFIQTLEGCTRNEAEKLLESKIEDEMPKYMNYVERMNYSRKKSGQ